MTGFQSFHDQGHGANAKPHLLIARLSPSSWGGVDWSVECPYEGDRSCGSWIECKSTEEHMARWGCQEYPKAPKGVVPGCPDYPGMDAVRERAWEAFYAAREEWEADHIHGAFHTGPECWYADRIKSGDEEPEYYLAPMGEELIISGPLKVLVGQDTSYGADDVYPIFKLWEEPTHDVQAS